ncbi:3-oxoadipate enol-lactonase [Pseudooceanicola sediminis]|uniref:3-oxoadipate enol-lactonase n=1 Tax=Pseudooceanicola sediminis TaxID=2211117 RepID=A0A399IXT3_9RHOB|nr:3-oxoadipate enol-lactonase [Pseudooceanicola sediminis]RII37978.1 3-oxoadipate enol-lactonase [Pseudooceanicola sediminis]|tara:strand:- start:10611 stop:11399 length:789 start_codon:yes stop_codon:yes gene_type:complete
MRIAKLDGLNVHYTDEGDPNGAPIVFANSLGTDLRLWDDLVPLLPAGLRIIRYDKRGHGLTDTTPGPYSMGTLVRDAEMLLDHLGVKDALFVGLSIGGMIAQGLAVKRLDLVRALVISNSAAKIGTADMWAERVRATREDGIESMADAVLQRWFGKAFRETDAFAGWRNMLINQSVEGYAGCCSAISGTDFYTPTSGLRLPLLGIAGSEDGSTPPDLVRETIDLVPGSRFELIRGAGHLPCAEKPEEYARILNTFIKETGHV